MHRYSKRLYLAAWASLERGYRPPTPRPDYEQPNLQRRYFDRHVNAARYRYTKDLERRIHEQNARIARRPPHAQSRHFELEQPVRKRVRFSLPTSRRDKDELDDLAREMARLSIRDPKHAQPLKGAISYNHPQCRREALEFKHLNRFKNDVERVYSVRLRA
ncbi:hypothetical protein VTK56DRAFT_6410 [Thermocarpiscus australiensis]